uniref:Zf-Tim10_DDP domain-containing protein n=1 Tax=Globodera pallida TaxID=36090 RepID=A0A183BQP7_GLOPA
MSKKEKCFKICMDKTELVEMHFENKEECVKVLAWTHHLASSQHIEDALTNDSTVEQQKKQRQHQCRRW